MFQVTPRAFSMRGDLKRCEVLGHDLQLQLSSVWDVNQNPWEQIDRLVQERRNSIANALELHLSCTNPSR